MNQKAKSSKSRSERSHGSQPAHVKSILTSIYEIRSTLEMPKAIKKFSRVDLDLFDYELHQLVQILRSWRNAKQPVNSLPAEILATIFGHCQYPLRDYLPFPLNSPAPLHREWRNLTRVCRLWRHISRECAPQLWSTIDLNVSPRTFLHRSGKAPLTIYAGIREPWTPSAQAIKVLNKHASRITEFHVSSPPGDSSAVFHALASLQDPCFQPSKSYT
ncbi:hypothetical protein DL96DRAFT_164278 [Flagelloscypha sp. PMI_526]|nr:hypothetical protein DL96DRAFT_164278 [Flagelloscypha sp. PMI_526]